MWSNDLGWVPKSNLQEAGERKVTKLQQFDTYKEVPQADAEGQEIISSRFVDEWEESGELRSRLVSGGYESSQVDPTSLFAATPSVTCAGVGIGAGRGNGPWRTFLELFFMRCWEKPFYVKPSVEYRKPGIVWKVKRYLFCDQRAPRG